MPLERKEIDRRFDHHPPRSSTLDADDHEFVRSRLKAIAVTGEGIFTDTVAKHCPREQALFHTKLEEASFWAHAALARGRAVQEELDVQGPL